MAAEIKVLEPNLEFAALGVRKDAPKGWNKITFYQGNKISTSSVSTITEGTNPSATTWGNTAYAATLTQYGLLIQTTDILMRNSAVEVVVDGTNQVKNALARQIDNAIQAVVVAGTSNIIYAGGKSARANLAAADLADATLVTKAVRGLRKASSAGLKPFPGGYYVAVQSPDVETDLFLNTSTGAFIDVGRYTSVEDIKKGVIGQFRGTRFLTSANVQTLSSTVTVHPTIFFGHESFGWGYFQTPQPILVTTADSNNPLNLYTSIGAKAAIGITRFEEARLARIESAVSS